MQTNRQHIFNIAFRIHVTVKQFVCTWRQTTRKGVEYNLKPHYTDEYEHDKQTRIRGVHIIALYKSTFTYFYLYDKRTCLFVSVFDGAINVCFVCRVRLPVWFELDRTPCALKKEINESMKFDSGFYVYTVPGLPQRFTATQLSSTSIMLRWDPPAEQFQNGVIRLYELAYTEMYSRPHYNLINTTETFITVGELKPTFRYMFRVRAYNDIGSGPWSSRLIIHIWSLCEPPWA